MNHMNYVITIRSAEYQKQIEEFLPIRGTNVSQTAVSTVKLGLFSKELWRFGWRAGWALSSRHSHYGRALLRPVGYKLSRWLELALATRCDDWRVQEEISEKTFHPWIASCIFQFTMAQWMRFLDSVKKTTLKLAIIFSTLKTSQASFTTPKRSGSFRSEPGRLFI